MFQSPMKSTATIALTVVVFMIGSSPISGCAEETESLIDSSQDSVLRRGAAVYEKRCVSCHGANGEGVRDRYEDPLIGDDSIGELSKRITETMPEDKPEECVGEDAAAVAAWIHRSFYSEAARVRNRPPRIALARLTGTQLRQSLADLYALNGDVRGRGQKRGLRGIYYDGARPNKKNEKIDRVDSTVEFDFGRDGPGYGITPQDFFIQWRGGLAVDSTGTYTIVIRSHCAFVCNLGRYDREFINNHVQSGDKTEFRRSIVLTGGRVYPIEIRLYQRKRKTEQPPADISLSWIPPLGVEQTVPARNLTPEYVTPAFSLQTKLPPDDRSYGYDRGIAVDRQWDDSTTAAAIEFAGAAAAELWPEFRRRHKNDTDKNRARLRAFLTEIVAAAFRGQLDERSRNLYVDAQIDATQDDAEAIRRSLLISLKSPRFLYPMLAGKQTPSQRVASRLALTLFDSLPTDRRLTNQIRNDRLLTEQQLREAARLMVVDDRAKSKTRDFLSEWLNLRHLDEISKNDSLFPNFDASLVSDLRTSFFALLDEVVSSEASDYRDFFRIDHVWTTQALSDFYGGTWKPAENEGPALRLSRDEPQARFGLVTHPYLMSGLAYRDSTSPIHRGVFLIRYMLGRTLRPPNEAFTPLSPDLHPDLTTRARVELQTSPESCQVCHRKINGLGFVLENFDAVGRYRTRDRQKTVNSAGFYTTRKDELKSFTGPGELAEFLASSDDAQRAFVGRAFQHFVKQPAAAFGPHTLEELTGFFRQNDCSIRKLLVEIAVIAATHQDTQKD